MRSVVTVIVSVLLILGVCTQARADHTVIVAIGADNVAGQGKGKRAGGVARSEAFPAQLEALLRAHAVDASVINAGVAGDTMADIMGRLDAAVPAGARLVILDRPLGNDTQAAERGAEDDDIDQIKARLTARHIALLVMPAWKEMPGVLADRDEDGHHFTAEGHARIAAYLLPLVTTMLASPAP